MNKHRYALRVNDTGYACMEWKMLRFFGKFARFGGIVRIQVEYRTVWGTQGYVLRMYGIGLLDPFHTSVNRKGP